MNDNENLLYMDLFCLQETEDGVTCISWKQADWESLKIKILPDKLKELYTDSELRYARFQSLSTVMCMLSVGAIIDRVKDKKKTGVITLSGPHTLDIANEYAGVILTKGEKFLNPIQFPYTIQSGVACEIAAFHGINGFAISTGYDAFAFLDAIKLAANTLQSNLVHEIVISCGGVIQPYFAKCISMDGISISAYLTKEDTMDSLGIISLPLVKDRNEILSIKHSYSIPNENYFEFETDTDDIQSAMPLAWALKFMQCLQNLQNKELVMIMAKRFQYWSGVIFKVPI